MTLDEILQRTSICDAVKPPVVQIPRRLPFTRGVPSYVAGTNEQKLWIELEPEIEAEEAAFFQTTQVTVQPIKDDACTNNRGSFPVLHGWA